MRGCKNLGSRGHGPGRRPARSCAALGRPVATEREAEEIEYRGNANLLSTARGMRMPLTQVEELASMFAFLEAAGYASDSPTLRETFSVEALTIEEWARRVSRSGSFG